MEFDLAAVRKDIAPQGKLRVAINLGNPVLAKLDEKTPGFLWRVGRVGQCTR